MRKLLLIAAVSAAAVPAAVLAEGRSEAVELEFAVRESGPTLEAYRELVEEFNAADEGIRVEIVTYGNDYGSTLKTRMASNSLPDVFTTHGWSVFLYGEYLLPLNDEAWVGDLNERIIPTVTDPAGSIVVLPFDIDITGIIANMDVLDALGLPAAVSLEEMFAQFEVIKDAGYTPLGLGGKHTADIAGLVGRLALPILTTSQSGNFARELYDGSFDWRNFDEVGETLIGLKNSGYLNVDALTGDKDVVYAGLANNEIAYAFQSNQTLVEVKKLNPEANVAMIRIPGYRAGDPPILISGERNAAGIWKDTEYTEEALEFLRFLARPGHVGMIAASYGNPPSMVNVDVTDAGILELLGKLEGALPSNHFDREYLPNGMWGTLKEYGGSVLAETITVREGSVLLEEEYKRLRGIR